MGLFKSGAIKAVSKKWTKKLISVIESNPSGDLLETLKQFVGVVEDLGEGQVSLEIQIDEINHWYDLFVLIVCQAVRIELSYDPNMGTDKDFELTEKIVHNELAKYKKKLTRYVNNNEMNFRRLIKQKEEKVVKEMTNAKMMGEALSNHGFPIIDGHLNKENVDDLKLIFLECYKDIDNVVDVESDDILEIGSVVLITIFLSLTDIFFYHHYDGHPFEKEIYEFYMDDLKRKVNLFYNYDIESVEQYFELFYDITDDIHGCFEFNEDEASIDLDLACIVIEKIMFERVFNLEQPDTIPDRRRTTIETLINNHLNGLKALLEKWVVIED